MSLIFRKDMPWAELLERSYRAWNPIQEASREYDGRLSRVVVTASYVIFSIWTIVIIWNIDSLEEWMIASFMPAIVYPMYELRRGSRDYFLRKRFLAKSPSDPRAKRLNPRVYVVNALVDLLSLGISVAVFWCVYIPLARIFPS
ncbi:hypothetical protein [Aestuariivirga sp.]|uniref:hypothetical protein n=1 Tax=Aestuariivirga sp. TaxID=2650926 RepID=UPI0039E5F4FD